MAEESMEVRREIDAPASRVWALVSHPQGHVDIDGSGMLTAAFDAAELTSVGQSFVIAMDRESLGDVDMGKYEMINTVTRLEPGHLIEWAPALNRPDAQQIAHRYGWIVEARGDDACEVVNYTDWSRVPDAWKPRWPVVPEAMLEKSLDRLEQLVTAADA